MSAGILYTANGGFCAVDWKEGSLLLVPYATVITVPTLNNMHPIAATGGNIQLQNTIPQ
jgi:hypothetical protein